MKLYSNVYGYSIYTLNYYEDKYFTGLFGNFKHIVKLLLIFLKIYFWSKHICLNYVLPLPFICVLFYEY